MAEVIRIPNNRDGYLAITDLVLTKGRHQPSRNGDTTEVDDLVIELEDPYDALPLGTGRKLNLGLAALEAAQLVSGESRPDLMAIVAPNTIQFMDDGEFHGAYGPRLRDQLPLLVERLKDEPDTRQGVVHMWRWELDLAGGKKDHPCTIALTFRIRDKMLLMSTYMRSNDHVWGWSYDAFQFTQLQLSIANVLDIPAGTYTHHAVSYHIYDRDLEHLKRDLHEPDGRTVPARGFWGTSWSEASRVARDVLDQRGGSYMDGEAWYFREIHKRLVEK